MKDLEIDLPGNKGSQIQENEEYFKSRPLDQHEVLKIRFIRPCKFNTSNISFQPPALKSAQLKTLRLEQMIPEIIEI